MAEIVTIQQLKDAGVDADTLKDVINGAANTKVTSRLGREYWTLATLDFKVDYVATAAAQGIVDINSGVSSVETSRNIAIISIDTKVANVDSSKNNAISSIGAKVLSVETSKNDAIANINEKSDEVAQAFQDKFDEIDEAISQVSSSTIAASFVPTTNGKTTQQNLDAVGADWYAKAGGYNIGDRVRLSNGTIVKSIVAANTNNPSESMTGWKNINDADEILDESGATLQQINNLNKSIRDIHSNEYPRMSGETSDTPRLLRMFADCRTKGLDGYIDAGNYTLTPSSAATTLIIPENTTITCDKDAKIMWGMVDNYYPAFAITKNNSALLNPKLVWTGQIVLGNDFGDIIGEGGVVDARLGTPNSYIGTVYCSGVAVLNCENAKVSGLRGESISKSATNVIHSWISAARANNHTFTDISGDDCVNVIVSQGASGVNVYDKIRGGRMNQDIGIPGHVVYSYASGIVNVSNIIDTGEETTVATNRKTMHTVSMAGTNAILNINNIQSKRYMGALDLRANKQQFDVSNVVWQNVAESDAGILTQGAVRLLENGHQATGNLSNINLDCGIVDMVGLRGSAYCINTENVVITKNSPSAHTNPFLSIRTFYGRGHEIKASLIQRGTGSAPILKSLATCRYTNFDLVLFNIPNPIIHTDYFELNTVKIRHGSEGASEYLDLSNLRNAALDIYDFNTQSNKFLAWNGISKFSQTVDVSGGAAKFEIPVSRGNLKATLIVQDIVKNNNTLVEDWMIKRVRPSGSSYWVHTSSMLNRSGLNQDRFGDTQILLKSNSIEFTCPILNTSSVGERLTAYFDIEYL